MQTVPSMEKAKYIVRSSMLEPQNEQKQLELEKAFFKDFLMKHYVPQMLAGDAVTLSKPIFLALIEANDLALYEKSILKSEEQGWFTCLAFMYFFSTKLGGETYRDFGSELDTKNKCTYFISDYASKQVATPFSAFKPTYGERTIGKALKKMWPVAHYWAAELCFNGKKKMKYEGEEAFDQFMYLAEKYRLIGLEFGIFEAIAANDYDPEKIVSHSDYFFDDDFNVGVEMFEEEDLKILREYFAE